MSQFEVQPDCQINPLLARQQFNIGKCNATIIQFDDLLKDTGDVLSYARNQAQFSQKIQDYFPGLRAPLPRSYMLPVMKHALREIYLSYGVPHHLTVQPQSCYFSIVNSAVDDLHFLQCIPHYDRTAQYAFAMIHYLNPGEFGGTGFFRHVTTGIENINNNNVEGYRRSVDALSASDNWSRQYMNGSCANYEMIYAAAYQPNRLVIYPASMLHSGLISPQRDIVDDPLQGRLTATFIFTFG